jgi:endonuclease G, mitochondrial
MKYILLLLACVSTAQAQDTVRVKHSNYETVFSKSKKYPVLVEWWVTTKKIQCANPVKRNDKFLPDPKLSAESNIADDYVGSGFDRGHLAPAADQQCLGAEVMAESFYFTNMAPQYPGLNRGQWKALEEHIRKLALQHDSVFVQAGCVGVRQQIKTVAVPTHCWKIVKIRATKETTAFVFENVPVKTQSFTTHIVTIDSVMKLRK